MTSRELREGDEEDGDDEDENGAQEDAVANPEDACLLALNVGFLKAPLENGKPLELLSEGTFLFSGRLWLKFARSFDACVKPPKIPVLVEARVGGANFVFSPLSRLALALLLSRAGTLLFADVVACGFPPKKAAMDFCPLGTDDFPRRLMRQATTSPSELPVRSYRRPKKQTTRPAPPALGYCLAGLAEPVEPVESAGPAEPAPAGPGWTRLERGSIPARSPTRPPTRFRLDPRLECDSIPDSIATRSPTRFRLSPRFTGDGSRMEPDPGWRRWSNSEGTVAPAVKFN